MLKGPAVYDLSDHHHHHFSGTLGTAAEYNDRVVDEAIYGSDEFRMYAYKIKRCQRMRSHDWTECPYAHRGEKAQRRDPRKFNYAAIVCPAFRNGSCEKGDFCEFAHGVFEYWLHPTRYRTRACNSGQFCQRKVCFFAHSPEQLRPETKFKRHYASRAIRTASLDALNGGDDGNSAHRKNAMNGGDVGSEMSSALSPAGTFRKSISTSSSAIEDDSFEKFSEFLKSLRALKISDGGDHRDRVLIRRDQRMMMMSGASSGFDVSESDLPNVEWILELVQ
ncbi:hypothetical protein TIFTF001_010288 [Ficus carica]|uniref:C3H1-type domain-containing protein n=1 Tax=Ficus carica TaxID=3494 RepID=A0AA87ZWV4_FICCA|nr:hypothetical protein TIFTF001_010288 [Ficus carica]